MPTVYNGNLISRAKQMRSQMTAQEQHLWYGFLSRYPVRFRRQAVIYHYIAQRLPQEAQAKQGGS